MTDRFSDEWYEAVLHAAASLPEVEGLDFVFDAEITEAPGKVRAHGRVADGRLVELASGKLAAADAEGAQAVTFAAKAKRLDPVLSGEVPPLVAYMRGELKIDGAYELVVDDLANRGDLVALEAFRAAVATLEG